MAYMTRLDLWGPGSPFPGGFGDFHKAMAAGGVGLMELVAMHLKRQGSFLCRSLSYAGCEFNTIVCNAKSDNSGDQSLLETYDETVRIWQDILSSWRKGQESGSIPGKSSLM